MDWKRKTALAAAVLVVAACVVLMGLWQGWWSRGTTELGVLPEESGGMVVHEPTREEFSSEAAWEAYQEHWRDPYWEGERPEGSPYKLASFADERAAGYGANFFVAGCVGWVFLGEAGDAGAEEVADICGATEHYLLSARRLGGSGAVRQLLLLYFGDDADLLAKAGEVEDAISSSSLSLRGFAQRVTPDEVSAYL